MKLSFLNWQDSEMALLLLCAFQMLIIDFQNNHCTGLVGEVNKPKGSVNPFPFDLFLSVKSSRSLLFFLQKTPHLAVPPFFLDPIFYLLYIFSSKINFLSEESKNIETQEFISNKIFGSFLNYIIFRKGKNMHKFKEGDIISHREKPDIRFLVIEELVNVDSGGNETGGPSLYRCLQLKDKDYKYHEDDLVKHDIDLKEYED
jgi:hypothetical protein